MNQMGKEMALARSPELNQAVSAQAPAAPRAQLKTADQTESLFEQFAWLYIFCREKLFRDDTKRIVAALWPKGDPEQNSNLIELGCGPGFYSCRLAARYPQLSVLGVDRSRKQLDWASEKAHSLELENCVFDRVNVLALSYADYSFDYLIASRLLTILPAREKVVAEMFRILRPGGRCFVAEPRYTFWASLPLFAMWMLAGLTQYGNGYREPRKAQVLSRGELKRLFASQPWKSVRTWQEGRYQYALCQKG
jgi:arsenite methyltransferase